jgi:hypothetical protein
MLHDPRVGELQKGAVERQRERGGDAPAPEEGGGEQPRRLALAAFKQPQQAERKYGEHAREHERAKEHAHDVRSHAREQEEMNGGRKREHRDQPRADRDADLAPTQRRAHARAAVIHVRYQGGAPSPAASPVLPAPPLKRGSGPIRRFAVT